MRLSIAVVLALAACGESGTGGQVVRYRLAAEPVGGSSFATRTGWQVELEEARIAVGPLYLYANPPPSAFRPLDLILPAAHAHSGFDEYDGGEVRGELLEPVIVDAIGGLQELAELEGVAGPIRSAGLDLLPEVDGHQAFVRGHATRGDEAISFEGWLTLPSDPRDRRVVGIPVEVELAEGTQVVLQIHVDRWFSDADFSALPGGAITSDTQVHTAWRLGARGWGAFTIR